MRRPSTRRKFLATLGTAGTLSIAGCSAVLPTGPGDDSDSGNPTGTPANTADSGSGDDATTDDTSGTPSSDSNGEVIEDFEQKIKSRWQVSSGQYATNTKQPYNGSQSFVLKGQKDGVSVYRSFYESGGLDLSKHDLSMAVKFKQPERGRVGIDLIAPAQSDKLTSRRFIPKELNDWTRIDLGYTSKSGNPVMKSVQELQINISSDGKPINVEVDDIRKTPKAKKGKVIFQFDDSHVTQYEKAFPKLKERNWSGGIAVIPDSIGTKNNMTRSNMREMGKAGWDMMAHPPVGKPLPQHEPKEQERQIRQTKQYLEQQGFKKGARHIVAPYGRISTKTIEIMKKYHDANYLFGGTPSNAAQPSGMYTIPRVFGTSPDDVMNLLDIAEQFNQLVVIAYHDIGTGSDTSVSMSDFEKVLNHVEKKDMDVVSPSKFLDSIGN